MSKNYMVVQLPKDDSSEYGWADEAVLYDEYQWAFDAFNEILENEGKEVFEIQRFEKPLRAELRNSIVELWIINRSDN